MGAVGTDVACVMTALTEVQNDENFGSDLGRIHNKVSARNPDCQ